MRITDIAIIAIAPAEDDIYIYTTDDPPISLRAVNFIAQGTGGGLNGITTIGVESGTYLTYLPELLLTGMAEFIGWAKQLGDFIVPVDDPLTVIITEDTTFVARFRLIRYVRIIWQNDSDKGTLNGTAVELIREGNYPVNVPTITNKPGWRFIGWTLNGTLVNPTSIPITQETTFIASYISVASYSITFNSNGGSAVENQTVTAGAAITEPLPPVREYFIFDGWYYHDALWNFDTIPNDNMTLVAHWQYINPPIDPNRITDWSNKIDYSKEIIIQELGNDTGISLKLAYAAGNEVVDKYSRKNKVEYGSYKVDLENKTINEGTELINNIFHANLLHENALPGYDLIQVAFDSEKTVDELEYNIDETICEIAEIAGTGNKKYPLALFKNKNINLAFDDLLFNDTAIKGLRENYEYNIAMYNYGRRITCYIYLTPKDIESVLFPNDSYRDFRGLFKLKINGEELFCRL
jgi:uncharacterized repeat protein (TIGR02543 family)